MPLSTANGGYIRIIFLVILAPLLLFFFLKPSATPSNQITDRQCYLDPTGQTKTVSYQNSTYRIISANSPVIKAEIFVIPEGTTDSRYIPGSNHHLQPIGQVITPETNRPHDAYIPIIENNQPQIETWKTPEAAGVENLLYVDITPDTSSPVDGYMYFDIYIKDGTPIPPFILDYCSANGAYPYRSLSFLTNSLNPHDPPSALSRQDPNQVYSLNDRTPAMAENKIYYLFSYEGIPTNPDIFPKWLSWSVTYNFPHGEVEIKSTNKKYKLYYNAASIIDYVAVVDQDPASPYNRIAFKYVTKDYIDPENFQGKDLNTNPTATNSMQLKTFNIRTIYPWGWWSPECKPAIYLYPTQTTDVNVKVDPVGFLTYTDPIYPEETGWNITSHPNGQIDYQGKQYPYLYYESKINDQAIEIPKTGYVRKYQDLPKLYDQILPLLGLNAQEIKDYKEYWQKYLPEAPYYFVGVMTEKNIDQIEPMTITPQPDTVLRVRLYYQRLEEPRWVAEPLLTSKPRQGFSVVEWGGMVKNDLNHPFTCSQ